MKISKTVVLMLGCLFNLAGLGLMFVSAAEKQLGDPYNAVHHVLNVALLSGSNRSTLQKKGNGILGINADNFVISQTGNDLNEVLNAHSSTILGGIKNQISGGQANVILGGQQNMIKKEGNKSLVHSVILGGYGNQILQTSTQNSDKSVILGGVGNILRGSNSVIGGSGNNLSGDYSIVLGNDSVVKGNNSVALGSGAKVNANNSFLWTDGSQNGELGLGNVFAIVSQNGVVVNTGKAHSFSQLTVGGSLFVYNGVNDNNLKCNNDTKGVLKAVVNGSTYCFCSCDGQYWNSLYGQGACLEKCEDGGSHRFEPKCGLVVSKIEVGGGIYSYSGSCDVGKIVKGTGDYVVTKDNKVHRSCQTEDGKVMACSGSVL